MELPNKLTPQMIDDLVASASYIRVDTAPTLTICVLVLTNGATVIGSSNCIDPTSHNVEIGREVALTNAKNEIWALEGYAMKRDLHKAG